MSEINNLSDLIALVTVQRRDWQTPPWFRGEPAETETTLLPTMLRPPRNIDDEPTVIAHFRQLAQSRHNTLPNLNDRAGWLFLMQHHGLPTRLLDWSENPLVALFHAVSEESDKPSVLWILNPSRLNKKEVDMHRILLSNNSEIQRILTLAFKGEGKSEKVLALMPPENDMRMFLQAGRATIHGSAKSIVSEADSNYLIRMQIPPKSKALLRHQLNIVAIRRSTLFPDLDSLASDIASNSWGPPLIRGNNA